MNKIYNNTRQVVHLWCEEHMKESPTCSVQNIGLEKGLSMSTSKCQLVWSYQLIKEQNQVSLS